jgi:hypothetical protein
VVQIKQEVRRLLDGAYTLTWIKHGAMPWVLAAMERTNA